MPLEVVRAGHRDKRALLRMLAAQLDEHGIQLSFERLAQAVEGALSDPSRGIFLVARVGKKSVGVAYLSFTWALEHGGRAGWLEELFVLPSHRGHGIGTALLRAAVDEAGREGCAAVDLEVKTRHELAERLYMREGFARHKRSRWVRTL